MDLKASGFRSQLCILLSCRRDDILSTRMVQVDKIRSIRQLESKTPIVAAARNFRCQRGNTDGLVATFRLGSKNESRSILVRLACGDSGDWNAGDVAVSRNIGVAHNVRI